MKRRIFSTRVPNVTIVIIFLLGLEASSFTTRRGGLEVG